MLNLTPISGNNQFAAAGYFSAVDDYYEQERPGEWQGRGAEALGLAGGVDKAQFARLLDGQLPNGDRIQTTFDGATKRKRMGLDLTFSAPKSVSMQALIAGDHAVTVAHDRAVARAMEQVEALAQARIKRQGVSCRERTANLVVAKFRHQVSRAKDPQLHTHAVVLNMTQRADGAWRALSNEDIFRARKAIDGVYQVELARELMALGYRIRVVDDKGNFELDHISRQQIEAFSARSRVIEEALANRGKTRAAASALEKQVIALATRPRKGPADRDVLRQYWQERSRELGIDFGGTSGRGHVVQHGAVDGMETSASGKAAAVAYEFGMIPADAAPVGPPAPGLPSRVTPAQAVVQYAIRHLTERESIVEGSILQAVALQRAVGLVDADAVKAEIQRLVVQGALVQAALLYRAAGDADGVAHTREGWCRYLQAMEGKSSRSARMEIDAAISAGALVEQEPRYTTHQALKREKAILAIERAGRGKVAPMVDGTILARALADRTLTPGQRAAIGTMVATRHRFVGIQGDAGTGKTYAVNRAVALIGQAHAADGGRFKTVALAPYGNQVKALRSEGLEAHTLAHFLHARDKAIDANTVVLLDEAGVVSARQMAQLMRVVEKAQARLVMIGDTKQLAAIEAGKPFAQLQAAGMQTARISEIQRQKEPQLRHAVEAAAQGCAARSLQHLPFVEEHPEADGRHRAVVAAYAALEPPVRQMSLMIAGTNEARRELNRLARRELALEGQGRECEMLTRVDMTEAQRRYAPSYQPGMVIQAQRDYPKAGLRRGVLHYVEQALPDNLLLVRDTEGTCRTFNPRLARSLSVYHLERSELAVGDIVRINRNDPELGITLGDRMRILQWDQDEVVLVPLAGGPDPAGGRIRLSRRRPMHLEHAYAATVHGAQGLTSERVFVSLDTRSRTASMNLYYVAISRARHEARVYTDSLERLPAAIARQLHKAAALEALHDRRRLSRQTRAAGAGAHCTVARGLEPPRRG